MLNNFLPENGFVRLEQITGNRKKGLPAVVPVSNSTIWNWVKDGKFPAPIKLSPSVTVWRIEEVREWIKRGNSIDQSKKAN